MSKRTAFSRKCEQRHWRLRHEQQEIERQHKRVKKFQQREADQHDSNTRETCNHSGGDAPDTEEEPRP